MRDGTGREIHYLRVSVTDRCNLRCGYCMPPEGVDALPHSEVLRYEEILRIVRIMARLGVNRVRLTGGEPLVRRGIENLAADIRKTPGVQFLGLTTNGTLLADKAASLCAAGVNGINISMDSNSAARYAAITHRDMLHRVHEGLAAALAQPFQSVKLNCVLAPDSAPDDWLGVVELARQNPVDVRLIEWMPIAGSDGAGAISADEALAQMARRFGAPQSLPPIETGRDAGPARYWQLPGFAGRVGLIHTMSHSFCEGCNRVRLTATGDLKLCLFYDTGIPLKPLLRGGASDAEIEKAITAALAHKPLRHGVLPETAERPGQPTLDRPCGMHKIGG